MNHLNPWEDSIRRGLAHHESTPPAMGWEKLEKALAAMPAAGTGKPNAASSSPQTPTLRRWIRPAAFTATAAIAASVAVVMLVNTPTADVPTTSPRIAATITQKATTPLAAVPPLASIAADVAQAERSPPPTSADDDRELAMLSATASPDEGIALASETEGAPLGAAVADAPAASEAEEPQQKNRVQRGPDGRTDAIPQRTALKQKAKRTHTPIHPQFAVHVGASSAQRMNQQGAYYSPPALLSSSYLGVMNRGEQADFEHIVGTNLDKHVESRVHHAVPYTVGLSISIPFRKNWSVRSGLTYTRLSTDIQAGSDVAYYTTQQNLHYVGIPLSAAYSIYSSRYFDAYASVGIELDKCVKATRSTTFDNTDQLRSNHQRTTGFANGLWQFSANASAGVQLNVMPHVGLYFEPGVSYFVNDGSALPHVRHDHPWNFNMQGGIRISLGE